MHGSIHAVEAIIITIIGAKKMCNLLHTSYNRQIKSEVDIPPAYYYNEVSPMHWYLARSVLKPRDIKHRDKLRAAFSTLATLEEAPSPTPPTASYNWTEPYL